MHMFRPFSGSLIGLTALLGTVLAAEDGRLRVLKLEPGGADWVEVPPPPPGTAEGDAYLIRKLIKEGKSARALSDVKRFLKKHGTQSPHYPDVLLLQSQALVARKQYTDAAKVLEKFFNEFAGIATTPEALRLKFVIAEAYLGGARKKVWGILRFRAEDDGLQMLDEIVADYPREPIALLALKTRADHLFRTGDHAVAELDYARLLREYPLSRYRQYAARQAAVAALASYGGIDFDDAPLIEAQKRFEDYRRDYPADAEAERVVAVLDTIHENRAEKLFSIAAYYDRTDHLGSAVYYYRKVLNEFPDTIAAAGASRRLQQLGFPAGGAEDAME